MEDKRQHRGGRGRGGESRGRGGNRGGGRGRGGEGRGRGGGKGRGRGGWKNLWKEVPHMDQKDVEEIFKSSQDKNSALSQIVQKDEEAFLQRHFNGDILSVKIEEDKDFSLKEVEGDLFSSTDSLAHCVSEDFAMSKGVAVGFRDSFGGVDDLLSQNVQAGGLGVLSRDDRWVFYLVTKEAYWHKPSYENVWHSLQKMAEFCKEHSTRTLSMPVIACGLDRLRWPIVKQMIRLSFCQLPIAITIWVWKEK